MSNVALTVLFATRNGGSVLPRTLQAYCHLEQPPFGWKLIAVDNGSDDRTPAVLAAFQDRLPLQVLHQPMPGKNCALNLGLSFVEGPLAILTDDDAVPSPTFLTAWSEYLNKLGDYAIFGGSIEPLFDVTPPRWMLRNQLQLRTLFAARDLAEGPIAPSEIYGPNMAIRTSLFQAGLRFGEHIGPNATDSTYPMGSETEFCLRAVRAGAKAWFAREPRVQHIVRSDQLSRTYWAERSYRHGRGMAVLTREFGLSDAPYPPKSRIREELTRLVCRMKMLSPSPSQRFDAICAYHWVLGFRDEWVDHSSRAAVGSVTTA